MCSECCRVTPSATANTDWITLQPSASTVPFVALQNAVLQATGNLPTATLGTSGTTLSTLYYNSTAVVLYYYRVLQLFTDPPIHTTIIAIIDV
eukprot:COSAG02_NODE_35735_length_464_cov_0.967123_1_plen_93_part_00